MTTSSQASKTHETISFLRVWRETKKKSKRKTHIISHGLEARATYLERGRGIFALKVIVHGLEARATYPERGRGILPLKVIVHGLDRATYLEPGMGILPLKVIVHGLEARATLMIAAQSRSACVPLPG